MNFRPRVLLLIACCLGLGPSALPARAATVASPVSVTGPLGRVGFTAVPATTSGLDFTNVLSPLDAARNQIRLNGSGVAAGDIDGDGRVDLFFAAVSGGSRLYRNLGDWRFADVTDSARLQVSGASATGACFADVDGDGDLDLLMNAIGGGTRLYANDGAGHFGETGNSGLDTRRGATSLALADIDRDGDLDLYVANYRTNTIRSSGFTVLNVNGKRMVRPEDRDRLEYLPDGRILEHGEPDILYRNDGAGRFEAVSWTAGAFLDAQGLPPKRPPFEWSLSAAFRDVNGDGAPDLYVCGDFHSPDHLWLNDGKGRFREAPTWALRHTPTFSMAVDFADLDRDGHDDFLVADMRDPRHEFRVVQSGGAMSIAGDFETLANRPQMGRNVLQRNRGDGTFAEIACLAGLEATGWTWSVAFLDVDLDGYEDLLTATGHLFDTQDLDAQERIDANGPYRMDEIPEKLLRYPPLLSRKLAYRNRGQWRFEETGTAWGWGDEPGAWQGMAFADLDNDGDLDVAVNRASGAAALYRNDTTAPRVLVRLRGLPPNTRGIGARITLTGGPAPRQSQEIIAGGRYLSGDDAVRVFAAGSSNAPLTLEVRWPGGRHSRVNGVRANQVCEVDEREASPAVGSTAPAPEPAAEPGPWFADESARIGHRHFETSFDDFERQPLLSRRLDRAGPGVGWIDLDGNGGDDLVVAAGRGGRPGILLNNGSGAFSLVEPEPAELDQIGVAGWAPGPGPATALVAVTGYESVGAAAAAGVQSYERAGGTTRLIDLADASLGPLAVADFDGDGDLDLFVGGTASGGRYPEASPSRLFEGRAGGWRASDAAGSHLFDGLGPVNGAIWSDLEGDGFPELVLACEWGPVRVFRNQRGRLTEATAELGFADRLGWWTGIQAGDVDGDGRLDLVAGNWGGNSEWRPTPGHPLRLHYGDLAGQGKVDLIASAYDAALDRWVPEGDLMAMAQQFPWLRERFPTHRLYGTAGVEALLERCQAPARRLEVNTLTSMVWLNRGARFEAVPLPLEAQIAPVFGVNLADFDLDGRLDLFLAQNFFAVAPSVSRQDAGRGLLMAGDGRGGFKPLDGHRSGIAVYGEQRGSASGDYDGDGRPDLVVAQNAAETRLFRNRSPAPGVRIRLRGPAGNPLGVGAVIRVRPGSGEAGPAQEIHGGGGYGSQDAASVCVPRPTAPGATVEVRWPGGRTSSHALAPKEGVTTMVLPFPPPPSP